MLPIYVGLCGRARNGKTTAVEAIRNYCAGVGNMSTFVADIGAEVLAFCKEDGRLPIDSVRETLGGAGVKVLVDTSLEMRQKNGPNIWLNRINKKIYEAGSDVVLCPNIRYPSEFEWMKKVDGYTVKMQALNKDGSPYIAYWPEDGGRDPNHESETVCVNALTDFYITAYRGQNLLVAAQAVQIFKYILALERIKKNNA